MNIAVRSHIISDYTISLKIAQCPDLQVNSRDDFLTNRHTVPGHQPFTENGSLIKKAVGPNQRVIPMISELFSAKGLGYPISQ